MKVIEHISTQRALALLDWISVNCYAIIFSGATPGQGGTQHINEQKQEYWLSKMISLGFIPCDNIRPILSKQKEVPAYYRNNVFFYINSKFLQQPKLLYALQETLKFLSELLPLAAQTRHQNPTMPAFLLKEVLVVLTHLHYDRARRIL